MILTDLYLLYTDNFSFFLVEATTISIYGRCFFFWQLGASSYTVLFFIHLFGVISPDNLWPYQETFVPLK